MNDSQETLSKLPNRALRRKYAKLNKKKGKNKMFQQAQQPAPTSEFEQKRGSLAQVNQTISQMRQQYSSTYSNLAMNVAIKMLEQSLKNLSDQDAPYPQDLLDKTYTQCIEQSIRFTEDLREAMGVYSDKLKTKTPMPEDLLKLQEELTEEVEKLLEKENASLQRIVKPTLRNVNSSGETPAV